MFMDRTLHQVSQNIEVYDRFPVCVIFQGIVQCGVHWRIMQVIQYIEYQVPCYSQSRVGNSRANQERRYSHFSGRLRQLAAILYRLEGCIEGNYNHDAGLSSLDHSRLGSSSGQRHLLRKGKFSRPLKRLNDWMKLITTISNIPRVLIYFDRVFVLPFNRIVPSW
jgi:hypothetical protein